MKNKVKELHSKIKHLQEQLQHTPRLNDKGEIKKKLAPLSKEFNEKQPPFQKMYNNARKKI